MIILMFLVPVIVIGVSVLAYSLAVYALPFMLAVEASRLAHNTGAGLVGALFVGVVSGAFAYGLLLAALATIRSPILRIAVAVTFAGPAALAGYALVHGITGHGNTSEAWRQVFCIVGATFVGSLAWMRLAQQPTSRLAFDTKSSISNSVDLKRMLAGLIF